MCQSNNRVLALLPSTEFYGKERSNIEVYRLLANHNIDIIVVINKNANEKLLSNTNIFKNKRIVYPNRKHKKFRHLKYLFELIASNISILIILIKQKPTILFVCSELTFYDFLPIFLFSKARILYRIGDAPAFPKLSNFRYNSWVWRNLICKKTDTFICISKFIKNEVEKTGRYNSKDTVIYNFPPVRTSTTMHEKEKYIKSSYLKIGYLGQIIKDKGVDQFLDAAIDILKERQDVLFYIAGSMQYDSNFSGQLLKSWKDTPFKDQIVFLDEIENMEVFFDNVDVLCIPSVKQEPLGNVLVESKKYHTPCIIYNSGGMPELVKHKHNGYICLSPTAAELRNGMEYYIKNPSFIKLHGNNAYSSIIELEINYSNYKKKWLKIFNSQTS